MHVEMRWHRQGEVRWPVAVWCPGPGWRMISSGVAGGGIGLREWVLNAQVPVSYSRTDPAVRITELAAGLGLAGEGVGLLTAASVAGIVQCGDEGVHAAVTVGLRVPAWAAAPAGAADGAADGEVVPAWRPGTINVIVSVPVPLREGAYVNAVMTATEALGFLDVRHDGITAELKVERRTPVTRTTAPKYMGQPTQYAAADGARLSILSVLDMSPKASPVGVPENYMFTLDPALHGLDNPEAPSLVAVIVINGNSPVPSSWSRRKTALRP